MDSSPNTGFFGGSNHNNSEQRSSGLLRFGSAPSSFLDSFANPETASAAFAHSSRFIDGVSAFPPPIPRQSSAALLGSSNLTKKNSSPPGLFSNLNPLNGYSATRGGDGVGGYRMANGEMNMKSPLSYSSSAHSSLGMLPQITEAENESTMGSCLDEEERAASGNGISSYGSGLQFASWSGSPNIADSLKMELDDDSLNLFAAANTQVGGIGGQRQNMSRQLSLPKTSGEVAALEKKLSQFPDSVPWNIRAKRGCATHPRSIAERVRRTRISERMRKLQELVPNMDKQTNTADMLDFAVEYIKDLQRQYTTLTGYQENCKCSSASDKRV
ncbi:unnamed protein product [Cuscuta epithymum]|uniref:BHLH domain-containing protein n=2 Tax=Cuscuta epithymum TaxID=186058 RepID=A0AAV0C5J3_9ASTE|nr:unnamed protein product [Cuscuta epithymum]